MVYKLRVYELFVYGAYVWLPDTRCLSNFVDYDDFVWNISLRYFFITIFFFLSIVFFAFLPTYASFVNLTLILL